jgi:hypothetical protein
MHVKTFVYGGAEDDFKDGLAKKIVGCYRSIEEECSINDRGIWKKHYDCGRLRSPCSRISDSSSPCARQGSCGFYY